MKTLLLFLFLLIAFTSAEPSDCGGNCKSGNCPVCHCGTEQANIRDNIVDYCDYFGSKNNECCRCLIKVLSAGNPNDIVYSYVDESQTNGNYAVGLFKIGQANWPLCNYGNPPCSPQENFYCAKKVLQWKRFSFSEAWTTETLRCQKYCPQD